MERGDRSRSEGPSDAVIIIFIVAVVCVWKQANKSVIETLSQRRQQYAESKVEAKCKIIGDIKRQRRKVTVEAEGCDKR